MCSPSGLISFLIASLLFNLNYLHYNDKHLRHGLVIVVDAVKFNQQNNNESVDLSDGHARNNDDGRHIHIIGQNSLQLNGVEVTGDSLVDHLKKHEAELIFGKTKKKRSVKLVHVRHGTDAVDKTPPSVQQEQQKVQQTQKHQRLKRSTNRQSGAQTSSQELAVHIRDNERLFHLSLRQSPKLIDDAFVFIRRYSNSTEFIEDYHELAKTYARCFYSNEESAIDLCDEGNMRGLIHHNSTDFIIHPLPERFGNSTHVIFESNQKRPDARELPIDQSVTYFDENLQFEPDEADFNEPISKKHKSLENTSHEIHKLTLSRNASTAPTAGQDYHQQRNRKRKQLHLNLRYKPRYHQKQHHIHQTQSRKHHQKYRQRRYIASSSDHWKIPQVLHIETAIFVDSDLFKHMAKNFPKNTENHLIRFVLAMINGVQLLYQHPSLGRRINFVLKRLEILYKDPPDLRRSSDIDTYLSNFCMWQTSLNPLSDADSVHYDHAVILTGLDLYVIKENGKVTSQVVGLAPVAGMCTTTSSCTVNEGKHFESVFVVAHEIGHNLGMRHDTSANSCDHNSYIMSPTLGSGKITWSKCSRTYLNEFLETSQAQCLFDRGQFINNLDHSAEGLLPGERFDANQQCMLKYGKDSVGARSQTLSDICRDLHCQRDRYTWTSHPALEGTECGENMWCRSGICAVRPTAAEVHSSAKQLNYTEKIDKDKRNFLESSKMGHFLHEYTYNKAPSWAEWGEASECESGCLYGMSKRLREGSTGLKTYARTCLDYRRRCLGRDRKFETCVAKQCYRIAIITIEDFAAKACEKAKKFDSELTGEGVQIEGDIEESCKVFCKTKTNGTKSRSWVFPDGTTCHSKRYSADDISYCIAGRCEKFSCDNSTANYYKMDPIFCHYRRPENSHSNDSDMEQRKNNFNSFQSNSKLPDKDQQYQSNNNHNIGVIRGPTTPRSKFENEVAVRSSHGLQHDFPYKRKVQSYNGWNKHNYQFNEQPPLGNHLQPKSASLIAIVPETEWIVKSGCHSSCMAKSKGLQVVTSRRTGENNIQLCTHTAKPCDRLLSTNEYAENTCARYKLKVRGLSGYGTQIAASVDEPDRSCRVGCQDEFIKYRFYLVNGKYGHFPLGTKCSVLEERYCVNGKCLEFGKDNIPLQQSHVSLALFRRRRSADTVDISARKRAKRDFLNYEPVNITETITQDFINNIVNSIISMEQEVARDESPSLDHIEFTNPIHVTMDELN